MFLTTHNSALDFITSLVLLLNPFKEKVLTPLTKSTLPQKIHFADELNKNLRFCERNLLTSALDLYATSHNIIIAVLQPWTWVTSVIEIAKI